MSTTSDREFHRDACNATRTADVGPMISHDHGEPADILLMVSGDRRLGEDGDALLDRLAMADEAADGFSPPRLDLRLQTPGF